MAFRHGKDAGFTIASSGGTKRNITQYLNSIDAPISADTAEVSVFNSTQDRKTYVKGMIDQTISLAGPWDSTIDGYMYHNVTNSSARPFTFYVTSTAATQAGFVRYSGSCLVTSYSPPSGIGDANTWSADCQITGAVTRSTASS